MRKFLIAAVAAAVVLAVGGTAYAVNVYTVGGKTRPVVKGSAKKPKPVSLDFEYTVADQVAANRGIPVLQYRIGAEGLVTYPEVFPACDGGTEGLNAPTLAAVNAKCRRSKVGGGTIKVLVGARSAQTSSRNCVLNLTLWNVKPGNYGVLGRIGKKNGGLAIRLDADPPSPPSLDEQFKGKCLTAQHKAILAPYYKVKIGGVTSDELRFTVPSDLLHPVPGLDATVRDVFSRVNKRTARKRIRGKRRKVGFYSAVGCKGPRRSIQVTFVAESNLGTPGQKTPKSEDDQRCGR
jgi:hypothetical protein